MEIILNNLKYSNDKKVIESLNLAIPSNKIIALYGNRSDMFINDLKNNNLNTESKHFDKVLDISHYNRFITNNTKDELYLNIKDYVKVENEIISILNYFGLNDNYLNKEVYNLSNTERKIFKLIIAYFCDCKTIIIKHLFNGLDYNYIKLFKLFIKKIRDDKDKLIFIKENDIDLVYSFVDRFMVVDTELIVIDSRNKVLENENIDKIEDISLPIIYQLQNLLEKKNIKIKACYSVNDLIKEVKKYV